MAKCANCGIEVVPVKKKFGWVCFLAFFGIIYLIYHFSKQPKMCPACGRNAYVIEGPPSIVGKCWFWLACMWGLVIFFIIAVALAVS